MDARKVDYFRWIAIFALLGISPILADETEKGDLVSPVEVPLVIEGRPVGKATVSAGTTVEILERRAGRVRVKTRLGEAWVLESGIRADERAPAIVPPSPAQSAAASVEPGEPSETGAKRWEWTIAPGYEFALPFGDGPLTWVLKDGQWIVIDREGRERLNTPFDRVEPFSEHGCAAGVTFPELRDGVGGRCVGLVGPDAEMLLEPEWDDVGGLIEGFVPVRRGGQWGYADERGELIIRCEWDDAWRFSAEGTAVVVRDGKRGIINEHGNLIVEPEWDGAINISEEGVGALRRGDGWALIDRSGKLLGEPEWRMKWADRRFDLGWISVWTDEVEGQKFGILGMDGSLLQPAEWDKCLLVSEGAVLEKADGERVLVGAGGQVVDRDSERISAIIEAMDTTETTAPEVSEHDDFELVKVSFPFENRYRNGKLRLSGRANSPFQPARDLVDSEGDLVLAGAYPGTDPASDFIPYASTPAYGWLDAVSGKILVEPAWELMRQLSADFVAVRRDGKWGVVSREGKVVVPPEWDEVRHESGGMVVGSKEGTKSLFTATGRVSFPEALMPCELVGTYGQDFIVRQSSDDGRAVYSLCVTGTGEFHTFADASKIYWNDNQAKAGMLWILDGSTELWTLVKRDGTPLGYTMKEKPEKWMLGSPFGIVRGSDGKLCYLDSRGQPLGTERWGNAEDFRHGMAAVSRKDRWGYVGEDGALALPLEWDRARPFQKIVVDGEPKLVASVRRDKLWGLIDSSGHVMIEPKYEMWIVFEERRGHWSAYGRVGNSRDRIGPDGGEVDDSTEDLVAVALAETLGVSSSSSVVPIGDFAALCRESYDADESRYVTVSGDALFEDTAEAKLLWPVGERYGFDSGIAPEDTLIFVERPPVFGYVKLIDQSK